MATPTPEAPKKITIRVKSAEALYRDPEGTLIRVKQGDLLFITISATTPLRKMKDRYCITNSVERASIVFWFAGCMVEEDDTAEKLKMRDGDTILVRMREGYLIREEPESKMQREYLALLEDDALADVRLLLGPNKTVLKIHRAIVCARNLHFRSLLQTFPGTESSNNEVEIPDCDPVLMKFLLQYIYAEKVTVPEDNESALELLCLADRYLCSGLKEHIEFEMMQRISDENIIAVFCAAYAQNTDRLKRHCRQYLLKHWQNISDLEVLKGMPELMFEVAEAAIIAHTERELAAAEPVESLEQMAKKRRTNKEGNGQA